MLIHQDTFASGEVTLQIDLSDGKRVTVRFENVAGATEGEGIPARDAALRLLRDFVSAAAKDLADGRIHWRGI